MFRIYSCISAHSLAFGLEAWTYSWAFSVCVLARRCCLIKSALLDFTVSLNYDKWIAIDVFILKKGIILYGVLNWKYLHLHKVMSSYCIMWLFHIFAFRRRSSKAWIFSLALPFMWMVSHFQTHSQKDYRSEQ